jgi:hypothetical protein
MDDPGNEYPARLLASERLNAATKAIFDGFRSRNERTLEEGVAQMKALLAESVKIARAQERRADAAERTQFRLLVIAVLSLLVAIASPLVTIWLS